MDNASPTERKILVQHILLAAATHDGLGAGNWTAQTVVSRLKNARAVEGLGRLYADTVLAMGGSKPAAEVFEMFRGRSPTATALLRHKDLQDVKAVEDKM